MIVKIVCTYDCEEPDKLVDDYIISAMRMWGGEFMGFSFNFKPRDIEFQMNINQKRTAKRGS